MPLLFLPSALLTIDIEVEEVDSAPMEEGALILPRLVVDRVFESVPRITLSLGNQPIALASFPGKNRHAWAWFPYGLYDVAATSLPWYEGDMVGLVSGASGYVYTAWYNDVTLAGDK